MSQHPQQPARRQNSAAGQAEQPSRWVMALPVILVTFLANMAIDIWTDWPMLLRWLVSIALGVVAGSLFQMWLQRRHDSVGRR
ncbi:hypothetical protein [Micrococcus luteus]|uniref:hypothetical protein n=1 Tax=Micrococcus luteus TaxID=1270 RepID=UPI0019D30263|nr:hypothetical protein [Micrococcus luteus]MBN6750773.1 hypothetical protein [Micrococcus luteus]MBN6761215.1 hypothetical protein [Micrococcus luteus]MBN6801508.1 hypothetical protein [Micrococcus luteus]